MTATAQQQRKPQQQTAPAQTTEIAKQRPPITTAEIFKLETALKEVEGSFSESTGALSRSFVMARGLQQLNALISEHMLDEVMVLMNSPLGFLTDKPGGNDPLYTRDVVKRCVIEAAIRGARWVGNEFNIISKRPYLTKEFFIRKVAEFPGLTDLKLLPGVPQTAPNGALVPFIATWKVDGVPCRLERIKGKTVGGDDFDGRIAVRVNQGMGADAILGKAERKMLAWVLKQIRGSRHDPDDDVDGDPDADVIDGEVVSSELTPEAEKASVDAAQAACEVSQDMAAGSDSGADDNQAGPADDQYLSELALNMESALQVATITDEQNIAIKQEIIDRFTGGNLQQFEAEHLQRLVCENKVRLSKQ